MYCNTKKFTALKFCGTHSKPHGERGLIKHYHLRFDPKLGNGLCAIHCIPCACVACTTMREKNVYLVYHLKNKNAINLSPIEPIGQ